jgi:hypothetical protein
MVLRFTPKPTAMKQSTIEIDILEIDEPQDQTIKAILDFSESINFDFPYDRFFRKESIALLFEYEKIRVTSDPKTGRYQLISGKRLLKICKSENYDFNLVEVQLIEKQDEDAEDVLIKHAINYCLLPICFWTFALGRTPRVFKFIDKLRKALPPEHRKMIPLSENLKKRLSINPTQGKNAYTPPSELDILIQSLGVK